MAQAKQHVEIEGRQIALSNLEKVLYPAAHFTKGQVIDYYARIAPYILPHLAERPITMKRFPDGVRGEAFYEKNAPGFTPSWIQTFSVLKRSTSTNIRYILVNDLPTLVWLANLASLEIHPFLHRAPNIDRPTSIVFDLDPGEGSDVLTCIKVAFLVRELLNDLGLKSFAKVSGSKGVQVYVPLNSAVGYKVTQPFAKAIAELLAARHSNEIVSEMSKHLRPGKVFIDWSQNSDFKTTVGVYSLRAKSDQPFVSLPMDWEELRAALKKKDSGGLYLKPDEAIKRVVDAGDLFEPVLSLKQSLPRDVMNRLGSDNEPEDPPEESNNKALETYRRKRDFSKTPEPAPKKPEQSKQGGRRRFVIQKHAASHLHYDFRLEMHNTLKSWAVPKGPPYTQKDKRLAMPTEDHPLGYLDFEGIIPKGQYGGGTVMVWDIGTYELIEGNYYKGHLHIHLEGSKLKGEWVLTRSRVEEGERERWYLIKTGESMEPLTSEQDDQSAVTQRTMAQIAESADAEWESNRPGKTVSKATSRRKNAEPAQTKPDLKGLPDAKLEFVEPMLAKLVAQLPDSNQWKYEVKLDGYRALALKTAGSVALYSRRGNRLNDDYPKVASALKKLADGTIVDGEVVALDKEGRPAFSEMQRARGKDNIFYYIFDLLAYLGKDVRKLPLTERRKLLEEHAVEGLSEPIRVSQFFDAKATDLVAAAKEHRLEGLVAKRANSAYESGERTGAWVKYKTNQSQELVVGGYMPGKHGFENLLAGYYEGDKLLFVGKIKNGFVPALRQQVSKRFEGLETATCPFDNLPEPKNARRGEALTSEVMERCKWLKPELVAQVEFTEWTSGNHLRHSRFAGLRDDKDPREVTHETAA